MPRYGPPALSLESVVRRIVSDELRAIVREELQAAGVSAQQREPPSREPDAKAYLPIAKAAELAAVHERTVRRWIAEGQLTGYRAGRVYRVCQQELESYLAHQPAPKRVTRADIRQRARALLGSSSTARRCA